MVEHVTNRKLKISENLVGGFPENYIGNKVLKQNSSFDKFMTFTPDISIFRPW